MRGYFFIGAFVLYNENMNYCECTPIKPKCKKVDGISIVVIPAQMGSSAEGELYAPKIGDYTNAVVKYLADGLVYVYDNTGNWTLIADYNAVTPTVDQSLNINSDNPISNRAVTRAINQLEQEVTFLDNSLATVAKTGDYDDLIDKPTIDDTISTTSTNAVANSAITGAINRTFMYDLEMTADADSVTFKEDKINPVTGATSQELDVIPAASTTTAGTISASEYTSIKNSQERLDALEGGSVAISGLSATPTQAELTTAWLTETGESALINRASIYDITNTKVWTYYTNTTTWYEVTAGTIQVNPFTNSVAGTILGSNTDGNVSANLDGTGTVVGWSTLVNTVNNKIDDSALNDVAFIDDIIGHVSDTAYVGTANIQTGAVTTAKIADLNVTEGKLASNSVTTSKVADGAITASKISSATAGIGDSIWTGNLYTVGDSESISTPLVVGGVYVIEVWGLSSYYKMFFPVICGSGFTRIQQAYSDGVDSCRWRISLDTTSNSVSLDNGSQNMGTNTAITAIYRIALG